MASKKFVLEERVTSKNGFCMILKARKAAVVVESEDGMLIDSGKMIFEFTNQGMVDFLKTFEKVTAAAWDNLNPKPATGIGSDYWEYYDKELDNNGYLSIGYNKVQFEKPVATETKLYQFNKGKAESFICDLQTAVEKMPEYQ